VSWVEHAACRGLRLDFVHVTQYDVEAATAVCATCRVRLDCLAEAVRFVDTRGVWGGYLFGSVHRQRTAARAAALAELHRAA
jgi:hypothetical protein